MYPWHRSNKYGAKKTTINGHTYDSTGEGGRGEILKLLQKNGEISDLQFQVEFPVYINNKLIFKYKADYTYIDKNGISIVEDFKGVRTPTYRLKKKGVEAYYGIIITEYPPRKRKTRKPATKKPT